MDIHDQTGPDFTLEPFAHTMRRNPQCHLDYINLVTEVAQLAKVGDGDLSKVRGLAPDIRRCMSGGLVGTSPTPTCPPGGRMEVWLTDDDAPQQLADLAYNALARLIMSHESMECLADPGERYRVRLHAAVDKLVEVLHTP